MLVVSAYQQYRSSSEMALLSDSTSSIATHLALDEHELAYVDLATDTSHPYVIDEAKLLPLKNQPENHFRQAVGGENFEFQVSVSYMGENEPLGPYGPSPENKMNCTIIFATTLFENGRYLPAKIKVMAWRA
jgi:hypothetical protein